MLVCTICHRADHYQRDAHPPHTEAELAPIREAIDGIAIPLAFAGLLYLWRSAK